jgi:restriction endonuclease S subunit
MEVRAGYKQTEVGIIPEDWEVKTCEEICLKIQDGTHFSPVLGGDDYFYITSKNIGLGILDLSSAERIDALQHKVIYHHCDVRKGDLLLTKDGVNTGNAALNHLDEEFSLLSSVAFLRFDLKRHEPGYYLQQVLSSGGQKRIKEGMVGNAITRLTLERIRELRFPVPPLPEQTDIAKVLSDADTLITNLEKLIAKKRNIKQGAMQLFLTGKKRLPGFSREWVTKKLEEIADVNMGQSPDSRYYNSNADGIPLIQGNADIENRKSIKRIWTSQKTKICDAGDLIMTVRAPVGAIGIATEYSCIGRGVCSLKPKNADKTFVFHLLIFHESDWRIVEQGSTFPAANSDQIRNFEITLPTDKGEQTAIVQVLSDGCGNRRIRE